MNKLCRDGCPRRSGLGLNSIERTSQQTSSTISGISWRILNCLRIPEIDYPSRWMKNSAYVSQKIYLTLLTIPRIGCYPLKVNSIHPQAVSAAESMCFLDLSSVGFASHDCALRVYVLARHENFSSFRLLQVGGQEMANIHRRFICSLIFIP